MQSAVHSGMCTLCRVQCAVCSLLWNMLVYGVQCVAKGGAKKHVFLSTFSLEVPSGLALRNSFGQRGIFDRISLMLS